MGPVRIIRSPLHRLLVLQQWIKSFHCTAHAALWLDLKRTPPAVTVGPLDGVDSTNCVSGNAVVALSLRHGRHCYHAPTVVDTEWTFTCPHVQMFVDCLLKCANDVTFGICQRVLVDRLIT